MQYLLALDPGTEKTGAAVLTETGELCRKAVVPTDDLPTVCRRLHDTYAYAVLVLGDGTNSRRVADSLRAFCRERGIEQAVVDERYTTEMGRRRYWRHTQRRGWRRFVPTNWQAPPEPVDDYVAWIIGEIYLGNALPEPLGHDRKDR